MAELNELEMEFLLLNEFKLNFSLEDLQSYANGLLTGSMSKVQQGVPRIVSRRRASVSLLDTKRIRENVSMTKSIVIDPSHAIPSPVSTVGSPPKAYNFQELFSSHDSPSSLCSSFSSSSSYSSSSYSSISPTNPSSALSVIDMTSNQSAHKRHHQLRHHRHSEVYHPYAFPPIFKFPSTRRSSLKSSTQFTSPPVSPGNNTNQVYSITYHPAIFSKYSMFPTS